MSLDSAVLVWEPNVRAYASCRHNFLVLSESDYIRIYWFIVTFYMYEGGSSTSGFESGFESGYGTGAIAEPLWVTF